MIRPLQPKDYLEIERMLKEDFNQEKRLQYLKQHHTFIMYDKGIKGFFTYFFYEGYPVLQHFCVFKKFRHIKYARQMIKGLVDVIKKEGHKHLVVSADQSYLRTIIEYYFKVKSSHCLNDNHYYLVEA
jgi:hypothetical protein